MRLKQTLKSKKKQHTTSKVIKEDNDFVQKPEQKDAAASEAAKNGNFN